MKTPKARTQHLLKISDLNQEEILNLFKFTEHLKKDCHKQKNKSYLKGQTLGMIFEKSSTRTRVSFETGIFQLGGQGLFLSGDDIQIGRGETIKDTARVLSRYLDGIMIRTFEHSKIEELAKYSSIPIINGLTDSYHPCQALTDFFTIYENNKNFKGQKITYIGDGNNMAHSLLLGAAILGMDISIASPKKYMPDYNIQQEAYKLAALSGSTIEITENKQHAASNANYIYTDVWASMGQEKEATKRKKIFSDYKIDKELLSICAPDCKIMHCLPAHRGEEIEENVLESSSSIVFEEAENRLHTQKAIMCMLMNK